MDQHCSSKTLYQMFKGVHLWP